MAFKKAVDKAQAALRRITPKKLGDFTDQEEFSNEDRKQILMRQLNAIQQKLSAVPRTNETAAERKMLGTEIFTKQHEIAAVKRLINARRSLMQPTVNDYLLRVAKEALGPEKWDAVVLEARSRARELGFRKDKK